MKPQFSASENPEESTRALDLIEGFMSRYVAFPSDDARTATVLWIAHAHLLEALETTPRIAFLSTEPGSGKSRALEAVSALVPRPMLAADTSVAVLYHKTAEGEGRPTILLDEVDVIFGQGASPAAEALRGIVNSGHTRFGRTWRMDGVGANQQPREFPTFAAVALAGLGNVPDTITTRSVVIRMRRRAPNETVSPWRERDVRPEADEIKASVEEWANLVRRRVSEARPEMPAQVTDRPADVWEPLIAIADAAGGSWPERARTAAVNILAASSSATSIGIQLLRDIRRVIEDTERMPSVQIVNGLLDLPDSMWHELNGKDFTARDLARWLKKYEIEPKPIRFGPGANAMQRGYYLSQFADAFARYLPPSGTTPSDVPTNADQLEI